MNDTDPWTTVAITRSTHVALTEEGKNKETFNDIIRRLLGLKPQEK